MGTEYVINDRVEFMVHRRVLGKEVLEHKVGFIKAVRKRFFTKRYFICEACKDTRAIFIVRHSDIFGKVEPRKEQNKQ